MNILKGIFNWLKGLFGGPVTQALVRAVLMEVIEERYGKVTPGNRQSVFSDVVDRLRDQGIDVKQHHRLIAQILDQEIEVEIAKK
ncbi:MAG: hypothetical protein KGY69_13180 [Bacteroidales bacterium]|nr:hypothetical protein [Bacteroidales bacterium]